MSKILFQRFIVIGVGVVLIFVTNYGYNITKQRDEVRKSGTIKKTAISRMTSKKTLHTYFVTIDGIEYDAGDQIPDRTDVGIGDTLSVKYKEGLGYVVPIGKTSYTSMFIFQIVLFIVAVALIVVGIFYSSSRIKRGVAT